MNKFIKGTVLFTALLLPVLIFVFLKMFGENQFDIPVFNYSELTSQINCDEVTLPHTVEHIQGTLEFENSISAVKIYHVMADGINTTELKNLMVAKDRLTGSDVSIHSIAKKDSTNAIVDLKTTYQVAGIWELGEMPSDDLNDYINCQLIITEGESLVLVDADGIIRGYYFGEDEKEIDRLIVESKIMLYNDAE
jgi:protein SCO1/2